MDQERSSHQKLAATSCLESFFRKWTQRGGRDVFVSFVAARSSIRTWRWWRVRRHFHGTRQPCLKYAATPYFTCSTFIFYFFFKVSLPVSGWINRIDWCTATTKKLSSQTCLQQPASPSPCTLWIISQVGNHPTKIRWTERNGRVGFESESNRKPLPPDRNNWHTVERLSSPTGSCRYGRRSN